MSKMLASYYGLQGQTQDAGGGTSSPARPDASGGGGGGAATGRAEGCHRAGVGHIDSAAFEPDAYVRHLLKTAPLEDLLRRDDELVHEVKGLDSDMQMLVYEVGATAPAARVHFPTRRPAGQPLGRREGQPLGRGGAGAAACGRSRVWAQPRAGAR